MTGRRAFTMIELLIAVALTATIVAAGVFAFTTASRVWRNGTDSADALHHGDYVMEQLTSALRSSFFPDSDQPGSLHGMVLENDGDDEEAHDSLSWVKLGSALVGRSSGIADSPHRIVVTTVEEGKADEEDLQEGGLVVRYWRLSAQPEDFDSEDEEFVPSRLVMPEVLALDFKVLDPEGNLAEGKEPMPDQDDFDEQGGLEWIDEDWKDDYTNRLPYAVLATLYLKPTEKGAEPIPLRRIVTIPVAPLSWRDKGAAGGSTETGDSDKSSSDRNKNGESGQNRGQERENRRSGQENGRRNGRERPSDSPQRGGERSGQQRGGGGGVATP